MTVAKQHAGEPLKLLAFFTVAAAVAATAAAALGLGLGSAAGRFLPATPPPCPTQLVDKAALGGWSVDVYNASGTAGVAADAAQLLKDRGVGVGTVGNQQAPALKVPSGKQPPGVIIAAPKSGYTQAAALQALLPESIFMPDGDASSLRIYLTKALAPTDAATIDSASAAATQIRLRCVGQPAKQD